MRNIKREGSVFSMDCYVDDETEPEYKKEFFLKFDVETGEFLSDMTGVDDYYADHALFRIRFLLSAHEPIPSDLSYVWY